MKDIIIIGAGTAGLTAALYACRSGKSVLVLENQNFGGQIAYAPLIENYPAVSRISGSEFADALVSQAVEAGADIQFDGAVRIEDGDNCKIVICEDGKYSAKCVIIACGVKHRKLSVEGEERLTGHGVSYCALCDGAFFKDQPVAVCGGGNTALTDALLLANTSSEVFLIHRREAFRGEQRLLDEVKANPKIKIIAPDTIASLEGEESLTQVKLTSGKTLDVSGLFVAIGQTADGKQFSDLVAVDENGFIFAGEDCRTSVYGIYSCGDCRTKVVRQLSTAASDGATVINSILQDIEF